MTNTILHGDCIEKIRELPDNSVDSVVTDPPYELGFMGKSWDNTGIANSKEMWAEALRVLKPGGHLLAFSGTRTYHRMAVAIEDAGFEVRDMIEWIYSTGFPKSHNVWKQLKKECDCGIMDEYERTKKIPESLMRLMSETDISQTITNSKTEWEVLQSELSEQSISVERGLSKSLPLSERGTESSLERGSATETNPRELSRNDLSEMSEGISTNGEERRIHNATQISDGSTPEQTINENGSGASHRPQSEKQQDREPCAFCKQHGTQAIRTFGVGSALKPAHEPICFARKPLEKGLTIAENVLKYGTGGINIDESRVEGTGDVSGWSKTGSKAGENRSMSGANYEREAKPDASKRFPANLIHDNSEEVRECFPETKSQGHFNSKVKMVGHTLYEGGFKDFEQEDRKMNDSGNASRFFKSVIYQAKASKSERNKGCEELEEKPKVFNGQSDKPSTEMKDVEKRFTTLPKANNHPTVKPIALMEYLIKMVTPKGGIVLDPFAGSGSTLVAAKQNGFQYIGIEMTEEYIPIIEARLK